MKGQDEDRKRRICVTITQEQLDLIRVYEAANDLNIRDIVKDYVLEKAARYKYNLLSKRDENGKEKKTEK